MFGPIETSPLGFNGHPYPILTVALEPGFHLAKLHASCDKSTCCTADRFLKGTNLLTQPDTLVKFLKEGHASRVQNKQKIAITACRRGDAHVPLTDNFQLTSFDSFDSTCNVPNEL